jgi:hypothetical protein
MSRTADKKPMNFLKRYDIKQENYDGTAVPQARRFTNERKTKKCYPHRDGASEKLR